MVKPLHCQADWLFILFGDKLHCPVPEGCRDSPPLDGDPLQSQHVCGRVGMQAFVQLDDPSFQNGADKLQGPKLIFLLPTGLACIDRYNLPHLII